MAIEQISAMLLFVPKDWLIFHCGSNSIRMTGRTVPEGSELTDFAALTLVISLFRLGFFSYECSQCQSPTLLLAKWTVSGLFGGLKWNSESQRLRIYWGTWTFLPTRGASKSKLTKFDLGLKIGTRKTLSVSEKAVSDRCTCAQEGISVPTATKYKYCFVLFFI